jgi:hypothetical protein
MADKVVEVVVNLDKRALRPLKDVAVRISELAKRHPHLQEDADYIGEKILECRDYIKASR